MTVETCQMLRLVGMFKSSDAFVLPSHGEGTFTILFSLVEVIFGHLSSYFNGTSVY